MLPEGSPARMHVTGEVSRLCQFDCVAPATGRVFMSWDTGRVVNALRFPVVVIDAVSAAAML